MSDIEMFFIENLHFFVIVAFIISVLSLISGYFIIKKTLKEQETLMANILTCSMQDIRNLKENNKGI